MNKDQKLIQLAQKGGQDAELFVLDQVEALETKLDEHIEYMDKEMEELESKLDTAVKEVKEEIKESIPNLDKVLESVRGTQGIQGETGERGETGDIGPQGETGPQGPQGERGPKGDMGENGKDGEVGVPGKDGKDGSPDTKEQVRDKLEELKDGEKLSIQAIQDLSKILEELRKVEKGGKVGGGFSKIHMDRHFIDDETPTGSINGTNTSFTISKAPNPTSSLKVYSGGIRLRVTEDYTISGRTITFNTAPLTNTIILVDFRY